MDASGGKYKQQVRWNDHLVNYLSLIYCYRINKKYIAFYIFLYGIVIISYKMLIITWVSNEKTNELTVYGILCQNITMFYWQELVSLFQVQEKLIACRSSKLNFLSSCFNAEDSHVRIVWLHVVVFSERGILHFWDNFSLFEYCTVKIPQNCFNCFNYSNQTCIQVSKFSRALDK